MKRTYHRAAGPVQHRPRNRKRKRNQKRLIKVGALALLLVVLATSLIIFLRVRNPFPDPKIDNNPPPTQFDSEGVVNIGQRREVFWDDYLIDTDKTTASRTLHEAQMQQVVLEMTEPWEGNGSDCFNIVKDEGVYRLYYLAYQLPTAANAGSYRPGVKVCYAESIDGLVWEKPTVNRVAYNGSTENNILIFEEDDIFYNFFVFIDTNEDVPENERYKALAKSEQDNRLLAYTSADGLIWKKSRALTSKLGAKNELLGELNTAFWDEARQRYYCYFAQTTDEGRQEIYVTTSLDFKAWTLPQALSYQQDAELFNLLTANISPYYRAPHIYTGFPLRYAERDGWNGSYESLTGSENRQNRMEIATRYGLGLTDTLFMTSRNGINWNLNEEAWLFPGAEHDNNWVYGDTYTSHGMIETPSIHSSAGEDNELSLYISAGRWSEEGAKLYRYTSRIDGFASYNAGYNTQKVVTKPITFEGSRMLLNFSTSPGGYVFVRILDENGNPFPEILYQGDEGDFSVPGYTSYELFGDRVDREVAFNGDLSALNGQTVILEFYMSDANLYSFKFDNEPYQNTAEWQPAEIPMREYAGFEYGYNGEVINIGAQRQLLWDDYIVDTGKTSASLVTNSAVRKEALFETDKPWEGDNCDYYNITVDEDESGRTFYRMYYLGWNGSNEHDIRVCYAYSYDGSEWIKPNLGIHSFYDEATGITHEETNIILYDEERIFDNFYVMKDPREGIPENERYKAVAQGFCDAEGNESYFDASLGQHVSWYGLWAWLSEDGIHWRKSHRILPLVGSGEAFDSLNTLTWDEYSQQYYVFFRIKEDVTLDGVSYIFYRQLAGCASADFFSWNPGSIYYLDYGDGSPNFEMYTNNIQKYYRADDVFLGFPTRFNRRTKWTKNYEYLAGTERRSEKYNSGSVTGALSMTETLFMTSRDGVKWNRRNASWLPPGAEHEANWIYGNCYPASGLIETATPNAGQDNELSTYVFEGKYYAGIPSTLYRYTMRIDGLACYKATYKEQVVTTKAFTFEGDTLLLNFRTSAAGSVRIRLLDENGNGIEGFDSGEIFGDRVDRVIPFEGDLSTLNGRTVIMEITMSDAEIYSFKFD